MRIAVLADTHDRHPPGLLDRLGPADEIWHLGDVCRPSLLEELQALGRPVLVVRGNNDLEASWPLRLRVEREGHLFHLEHIAPYRPPADTPFFLHGHTHVFRDEFFLGTRWFNPGAITAPRGGGGASFAWLHAVRGAPPEWTRARL